MFRELRILLVAKELDKRGKAIMILSRAEQSRAELESCNFVKTVLMLIVVIYHCILFWTGTWFTKDPVQESKALQLLAEWMNSFHIYGFTLVSGYIFFHVKHQTKRYKDYKKFLLTKAKRLLVPYAFAAIVWVIPMQLVFYRSSVGDLAEKYVLGLSPSQLWFLLMLFGVFAIMWPLSDFIRKHNFAGLVVVGGLWVVGIVGSMLMPNVFQFWTACKYCIYFWLGLKMCQYGTVHLKKIPAWVWVVGDIALFLLTRCIPNEGSLFKVLSLGVNLILSMVGAITVFIVLSKLSDIVAWKNSKVFSALTKYSFPIYLFHQQLIYCTIALLNGKVNPYVNAGVNVIFAIGGSLLISWVLMRFKATRVLIGENG